jgi:uroporphyrinogen-III synthase
VSPCVLITRSPHQASDLADRLRSLGVEPVLIPALEIAVPSSFAALDAALHQLDTFDWLLFTSANAVEAFHRRLESQQVTSPQSQVAHPFVVPSRKGGVPSSHVAADPGAPSMPQSYRGMGGKRPLLNIAAIGPATARALEAIGLTPTLIPPQAVAESLAEALLLHARQPNGSPTRFLLLRAESGGDTPPREHLPETLHAAGADVTIAPAYRTLIPADSIPAIRALFQQRVPHPRSGMPEQGGVLSSQPPQPTPDAITFTSSSTVHNLLALCQAAGVPLPLQPLRISIGPITSQTLRDAGYPPHAEAPEATVASLAETVVKTLKAH